MRCGRELLGPAGDLTAVVAGNDMLAVGCYGAFDELGLRCPEDVSVIGFNDMPFVDRLRPPLSSVRFPHYQLGTEAATLLIERIEAAGQPGEDPLPRARARRPRLDRAAGERVRAGSAVPLRRRRPRQALTINYRYL